MGFLYHCFVDIALSCLQGQPRNVSIRHRGIDMKKRWIHVLVPMLAMLAIGMPPNSNAQNLVKLEVKNICSETLESAIERSKVSLSNQLVAHVDSSFEVHVMNTVKNGQENFSQDSDKKTKIYTSTYLFDYQYAQILKHSEGSQLVCIHAIAKGDRKKALEDIEWQQTVEDLNISLTKPRHLETWETNNRMGHKKSTTIEITG